MTTNATSRARGRIVVVGGGLAGIQAALAAADAGASVTLVERRNHLGGLTWSFRHNGLWFDNGQHVFMRCCDAYRGLLDRIGASEHVSLQSRLDVPVLAPGGRRARIARTGWPAPLHLARALARYNHLSRRERARLGHATLALKRLPLDELANDDVTFGDWLGAHSQDDHAIERLWDLIVRPTVNLPSSRASLAAAAFVFRVGLLDRRDAADIGWSRVPLGRLHGDLADAALERAGVEVMRGCRVRRIDPDAGVVLDDADRLIADATIVALPHTVVGRVLPEHALDGLDPSSLGISPIVNVHLVFDRRVTDLAFAAAVGSPVEYVFDRTDSSGLRRGQYLALSLSAADGFLRMHPRTLIATMVDALGELLPAVTRASLVDALVTREREATFAATPGTARLRPGPRTRVDGVFVAGAWTATGWPATMEGAVRSGRTAADAALASVASRQRHAQEVAS